MNYRELFSTQRNREIAETISKRVERAFSRAEKEGISWGKDSNGRMLKCPPLSALGLSVDKWWVLAKFPKDDFTSLRNASIEELRNPLFVKELKRDVKAATHIIPTVRMFHHIQQNYVKELSVIDALLSAIEEVQASLIERRFEALLDAIPKLEQARDSLSNVRSATKTRASKDLSHALKKLSSALRNGSDLPRAEMILTNVRHNLITRRVDEIASRFVRAYFRELFLRRVRDEWLLSLASQYASDPLAFYRYYVADRHNRLSVLEDLKKLAKKRQKPALLQHMVAFSHNFRISQREREGAESFILESYAGKKVAGAGKDALIGHYALAYKHALNGEWQLCIHELDSCILFVRANKPDYLMEELAKGDEPYLQPVISALESLVNAFNSTPEHFSPEAVEEAAKEFYAKTQQALSIKD